MPSLILLMILATAAFSLWNAHQAAFETARRLSQEACAREHVQWLDDSVHLVRWQPQRKPDGRIALLRTYRFDFSETGANRITGQIRIQATQFVDLDIPRSPEFQLALNTADPRNATDAPKQHDGGQTRHV